MGLYRPNPICPLEAIGMERGKISSKKHDPTAMKAVKPLEKEEKSGETRLGRRAWPAVKGLDLGEG